MAHVAEFPSLSCRQARRFAKQRYLFGCVRRPADPVAGSQRRYFVALKGLEPLSPASLFIYRSLKISPDSSTYQIQIIILRKSASTEFRSPNVRVLRFARLQVCRMFPAAVRVLRVLLRVLHTGPCVVKQRLYLNQPARSLCCRGRARPIDVATFVAVDPWRTGRSGARGQTV